METWSLRYGGIPDVSNGQIWFLSPAQLTTGQQTCFSLDDFSVVHMLLLSLNWTFIMPCFPDAVAYRCWFNQTAAASTIQKGASTIVTLQGFQGPLHSHCTTITPLRQTQQTGNKPVKNVRWLIFIQCKTLLECLTLNRSAFYPTLMFEDCVEQLASEIIAHDGLG